MAADTINEGDDDSNCSGYLDASNDMLSYRPNNDDENGGLHDEEEQENAYYADGCNRSFGDYDEIDEGYNQASDIDQELREELGEEAYSGPGISSEQGNGKISARADSSADVETENWLGSTMTSEVTIQYPEVSPLCGGKAVQRTTDGYDTPRKGTEKSSTTNPTLLL